MKLKIVKPKPKFYRISYAMLDNLLQKEKPLKKETIEPKKTVLNKSVSKFADKYDKIVDEAIQKHLIDESDREMKLLELKSLSDEEFDNYVNEVHNEESINVTNVAEDSKQEETEHLTEAELALKRIKQSGPIIGDFSQDTPTTMNAGSIGGSNSRSLSDIQADRKLDMAGYSEEKSMDDIMSNLSNSFNTKKKTVANKKPMSDFKGLTKPIVHESKQFTQSMSDIFSNLDWTMGSR